ncbi:MAG: TIGR02281 family clan AA aspartic protease [Pseudomonadota bacterium]
MVGRLALFAALILGFTYLVVPREGSPGDPSGNDGQSPHIAHEAERVDSAESGANAAWFSGDQTLARRGDGHFYATTSVNGASTYMLVDTGASVIALTGDDARAAGLYWNESDVRPIGRGASGTVYGVPTRLDEVAIGDLTQRNVDAVIVPNGLDVSLLGQSYLGRLNRVEISGDTMQLSSS